jgi:single-stranded-DNA-specific exonuclease
MPTYSLKAKAPKDIHDALAEHPELVRELLWHRGITDTDAAREFLAPSFERHSHDPFLLPDMERAVERILAALRAGEKIAIWSDYDCDGIPGGALLHDFFRLIGYGNFINYIPHRHLEGYGLNKAGLTKLKGEGASLVITVDSGITDIEPVAHANSIGLEVIVTDHHLPRRSESGDGFACDKLPPAYAVINPKRTDNAYPFDGLAGTGVAWKLVQAILRKDRFGVPEGKEKWLLDLVGLATVADMMPLIGENRALVHFGLIVMRKNRRPGLRALLSLARTRADMLTEEDIGFTIGPRINAASRMDEPRLAFDMLTALDDASGKDIARELTRMNDARKGTVAAYVKEAKMRLEQEGVPDGIIVMGNPAWRPGLLGLVANSLAETYGKPVALWGREGGHTIKGSVRSDGVVNMVELMASAGDVFADFGGHKFSGGFSLDDASVHSLKERLGKAHEALRERGVAEEPTYIDRELELSEAPRSLLHLEKLAPFGIGNEKPLFLIPGAHIANVKTFGKAGDHIELMLTDEWDAAVPAIAFFSNPESFTKRPEAGGRADVVAHLERSSMDRKPRLRIVDVI